VRAFLGYMYAHPGKKLLFMGSEIGQYEEWNWQGQIRWDLLQYPSHRGLQEYVRELNYLYASEPSLHEVDAHWKGFEWIDFHDIDSSVISFVRRARRASDFLVFVCNFTPLPRHNYNVGVPEPGSYQEILNSDWEQFGGSGVHNHGLHHSTAGQLQGRHQFITLSLPPLGVCAFRRVSE
jgi:1,4-alpha-glucan branching enzyme